MKSSNILGWVLSILIGVLVFFVGMNTNSDEMPNRVYKVYLNGQPLGLIASKESLLNIIDEKQKTIKEQYAVSKVHPPSGLEIVEEFTYSTDIKEVSYIYELIENKDPFTIDGYIVNISYPIDEVKREEAAVTNRESISLYVLNKTDFEEAFKTVIKAFVGPENFEGYANNSQAEIIDVGSRIDSISWEEDITIKGSKIGVDSLILTSPEEISKYLFFGTLEDQEYYKVKDGDSISSISASHNLNPDEFLVANPEFGSKNVPLTPGQLVNVGLIKPLVTIVSNVYLVEDITYPYRTEYVDNKDAYLTYKKTIREGANGVSRLHEMLVYKNGEIHNSSITDSQELLPIINQIIERGTRGYMGGTYHNTGGNEEWSWPTNVPYIITSRFAPRWGKHHNGIDIAGPGFASPIRAVQAGTVTKNEYTSGYGNYITITHPSGHITLYAHLARKALPAVGTTVKREQVIGYMGSTGNSTGNHLHFEVRTSAGYLDPCNSIFKC